MIEAVKHLLREQKETKERYQLDLKELERRHHSDMEKMALQLQVILLRHGVKVDPNEIPKPQLPAKED